MITITRSKCGIRISDVFFAHDPLTYTSSSPICYFVQAATRHPSFRPFQTSVINLSASVEDISAPISRNTRYKIQRAEREGLTPRLIEAPSDNEAILYADYYDTFAAHKNLPKCNRPKLRALCASSALLLSSVSDSSGRLLAAHAYVRDSSLGRVRLLYSASHFRAMQDSGDRNKVGRANRLLHWYEILTLRNAGFELYDLGGLPLDTEDKTLHDIARFKMEFGGTKRVEYSGPLPTNLIGKVILSLPRRKKL